MVLPSCLRQRRSSAAWSVEKVSSKPRRTSRTAVFNRDLRCWAEPIERTWFCPPRAWASCLLVSLLASDGAAAAVPGVCRVPCSGSPSALVSGRRTRSEEHTPELQSQSNLVCRLLLEKEKTPRGLDAARSAEDNMQTGTHGPRESEAA